MAKNAALIIGIVFLLVGALGMFPNSFVGEGSLFEVNVWHNVVHLVTGLIFVWIAAKSPSKSSTALNVFGVIYIIVAIAGFFVGDGHILGVISNNSADNWLHLVLGVLILVLGLSSRKSSQLS